MPRTDDAGVREVSGEGRKPGKIGGRGKGERRKKSHAPCWPRFAVARASMGQAVSISRTKNDFELVIRATKELEWILEAQGPLGQGRAVNSG